MFRIFFRLLIVTAILLSFLRILGTRVCIGAFLESKSMQDEPKQYLIHCSSQEYLRVGMERIVYFVGMR